MPNLINPYAGDLPFRKISIQKAIETIKQDIESAIYSEGTEGKNRLIRSQKVIGLIHDALKTEFYNAGVHESLINQNPAHLFAASAGTRRKKPYSLEDKEHSLAGYFKTKKQDICVIPRNILSVVEKLPFPTLLEDYEDSYGCSLTEAIISVNVRSQLSSTNKNFDTLYERTIAEALNLHMRCPKMVLGEVYLIIAREYDEAKAKEKEVGFKHADNLERYIRAFRAINGRKDVSNDFFKYERCCLLIVDFSKKPKIYNDTVSLIRDGLLDTKSSVSLEGLSYESFVQDVLDIYRSRFPGNKFN